MIDGSFMLLPKPVELPRSFPGAKIVPTQLYFYNYYDMPIEIQKDVITTNSRLKIVLKDVTIMPHGMVCVHTFFFFAFLFFFYFV